MDREPTFKRQVGAVLRWFGLRPKEDVHTMTRRELREVDKSLSPSKRLDEVMSGESRKTHVVKRRVQRIVEKMHDEMDQETIRSANETLEEAEKTYDHAISLKTKAHTLRHLDTSLDRKDELAEVEHEARMAETAQRVDKADPVLGALRRQAEEESLKTEIAKERAGQRYYESQPRSEPRSPEAVDDEGDLDEAERQRRAQAREYVKGTDAG